MTDKKYLKEKIVKTLSEHPEGLSIIELSALVGSHRNTVTKYIYELIGARVIYQRNLGNAKLLYLASKFPEKTRLLLEKLKGRLAKK